MAAQKQTATPCRERQTRVSLKAKAKAHDGATTPVSACEGPAAPQKFRLVKALKAREREVERATSMIYGALPQIIGGIIQEAIDGNHNAARFLMQYAGIREFALPAKVAAQLKPAKEESAAAKVADMSPEEAVASFYKKLGYAAPALLPPRPKPATPEGASERWMVGFDGHASPGKEPGIAEMNRT